MEVYDNQLYRTDIRHVAALDLPWDLLQGRSILISGARGLIGSCLIDVLMERNAAYGTDCMVYALGRNTEKAQERFAYCWSSGKFRMIAADINRPLEWDGTSAVDYVIHLASNTHPVAYATDPIGTITANIIGTNNLLEFAKERDAKRFVFASSVEIYGENRGDVELFDEDYCGYLNSNTLRAGYPESKRCGEALCQAYREQEGVDIVIPRLARTYGPTMLPGDTKALSQFLRKGLSGEDIVLKSAGTQYYSYTYVTDAVAGLFTVLLKGAGGEAYNIADKTGDIMLKELAGIIAEYAGTQVVFELPDEVESAGYSTATKARLNGEKIRQLGWQPRYNMRDGIKQTMSILRERGQSVPPE
ncbi:MAG: NAD-dependent epimerase/dehydratase family protein [Bacteroidales bacterium]|nr:NAD-dependent epimerase/dehydratase family protein [Bacteroidales bacterium]